MAGYHLREIQKGTIGQLSKIREELEEAEDADAQGVDIMVLLELSDMIGAVEAFLEERYGGWTIEDLSKMAAVTRRAFHSGNRT